MNKTAILLGVLLLTAAPSFAQIQQFGVDYGGSLRMFGRADRDAQPDLSDNFKLSNSVKEIWYTVQLEPDTLFKIKVGEIDGLVGSVSPSGQPFTSPVKGKYEHVDAIIDYRFDEAFGSTGLFAGFGAYRATAPGIHDDTNYGLSAGVNGDFPITKTYGIVTEGAYHWINMTYKPRIITVTAGLRIRF